MTRAFGRSAGWGLVMFALVGAAPCATRALAADAPASLAAPAAASAQAHGLGSAGNPIPLPSTGTSAVRLGRQPTRDRIAFALGALRASLFGSAATAMTPGGGIEAGGPDAWDWDTNVYAGGGVELGLERSSGLHVEGGRVTLHDPIGVLDRGGSTSEYWSSSAALVVRF